MTINISSKGGVDTGPQEPGGGICAGAADLENSSPFHANGSYLDLKKNSYFFQNAV